MRAGAIGVDDEQRAKYKGRFERHEVQPAAQPWLDVKQAALRVVQLGDRRCRRVAYTHEPSMLRPRPGFRGVETTTVTAQAVDQFC